MFHSRNLTQGEFAILSLMRKSANTEIGYLVMMMAER